MRRFVVTLILLLSGLPILAAIAQDVKTNPDAHISPTAQKVLAEAGVDKLLFVKRYTYQSSHYYTDFIDGCENFGGNIYILSLKDGKVTELVPELRDGIFGRFDLSFDSKRVVFDLESFF